tara:strand:- start:1631 stop:1789 length:159 start_codon:yes stop_codon:yes gene_type:complete
MATTTGSRRTRAAAGQAAEDQGLKVGTGFLMACAPPADALRPRVLAFVRALS